MEKIRALFFLALASLFLFTGCGQDLNVTVINRSSISWNGSGDYIWINVNTERFNKSFLPTESAMDDKDINSNNSFSFKAKENDTITINTNGKMYQVDGDGNTTLVDFESKIATATLFGGFPDAPDWYAGCYYNEIIIYRK